MELDSSLKAMSLSCNRQRDKNNYILPDDILMEIMCRLPDKHLHRFKCLSKEWCFLISKVCIPRISMLPTTARARPVVGLYFRADKDYPRDFPFFVRSPRHPVLFHFVGDWIPEKFSREGILGLYASLKEEDNGRGQVVGWEECVGSYGLPFTPDPDELLDCCNGLLLFFDTDSSQYYVCNPITKQCLFIPRPQSAGLSGPHPESFYAAVVFDPSKSPYYSVVRFDRQHRFDRAQRERLFLDIYSSVNKSWSRHSVDDLDPLIFEESWFRYSTYFNGALFRLARSWNLVQFNLLEEEISVCVTKLPLTSELCKGYMGCIGVLMGQLCYANEYCNKIFIWSLEKEGSHNNNVGRWIARHSINIYDLTTSGLEVFREDVPPNAKWVGPIAFHPSSNVVFLGTPIVILAYNLNNKMVEELIRMEKGQIYPGCYCPAFPYVRLLSPFDKAGNIQTLSI